MKMISRKRISQIRKFASRSRNVRFAFKHKVYFYIDFLVLIILFSIFYIIFAEFTPGTVGVLRWLLFFLLGLAEFSMYLVVLKSIINKVGRFYETSRLLGFPNAEMRKSLWKLTQHTALGNMGTWLGYFVCIAIFILLYSVSRWRIFIALMILFTQLWIVERVKRIVPPTVLFLTTSGSDRLDLFVRLDWIIRRLRVVALIRLDEADTNIKRFLVRSDCFRTTDDEIWEDTVIKLMEMAPIIIFDTRLVTPPILTEINHLLDSGYTYKTIFLGDESGDYPALKAIGVEKPPHPHVTEDIILETIYNATRSRETLPGPDQPIYSNLRKLQIFGSTTTYSSKPTDTDEPPVGLSSTRYIDPKGYFSITPPEGWQITEYPDDPRGKVAFSSPNQEASMRVLVEIVDFFTREDLVQRCREIERKLGTDTHIEEIVFNDMQAVSRHFYQQGLRISTIDIPVGGANHNLYYATPRFLYKKYLGIAMRSFETYEPVIKFMDYQSQIQQMVAKKIRLAQLMVINGDRERALQYIDEGLRLEPDNTYLLELKKELHSS